MNKFIVTGNLARNPELKELNGGKQVCRFDIAVTKGFGDNKEVFFLSVSVWGKTAENCEKYLEKGSKVLASGELSIREYTDKDGIKRKITELNANEIEFISTKKKEESVVKEAEVEAGDLPDGLPF